MKIIVFASTKGGPGKTTLCYNTAVYVAKKHDVLLVDRDPQLSMRKQWLRRPELENPRLVSNVPDMAQAVDMLSGAGLTSDYLFVDTPGSFIPTIRDSVSAADVVVLPTRASHLDLDALEEIVDIVKRAGKLDQSLFVLNQIGARDADIAERAEITLQSLAPLPIVRVPTRVHYVRGTDEGITGIELSKDATKDIKLLWEQMQAIMAKTTPHRGDDHDQQIRLH